MRRILISILVCLVVIGGCSAKLQSLKSKTHKGLPSLDSIGKSFSSVTDKAKSTLQTSTKNLLSGGSDQAKLAANIKAPSLSNVQAVLDPITDAAKQAYKEAFQGKTGKSGK